MAVGDPFDVNFPIIGMVHLQPLPGSPNGKSIDTVRERALTDAIALESGGIDGIVLENYGDAPFYPDEVPKHTVAMMSHIATEISHTVSVPVGVNVLRNDAAAAVSIAAAVDGKFVRVNVHTGARVTDQGVIDGRAHETMRLRDTLDADIAVFADIDVKHSTPLTTEHDPADELTDAVERGLADGVIVSGSATGKEIERSDLHKCAKAIEETAMEPRILIGSGVGHENVQEFMELAHGAIVGSAFKRDEDPRNPIVESRVHSFMQIVTESRDRK